jgi:hypothetical protein
MRLLIFISHYVSQRNIAGIISVACNLGISNAIYSMTI